MSYEGQAHHPHLRGYPPNSQLLLSSHDSITPQLELVQAHWFVRHGERAPVRQRMVGLGQIPPIFQLCSIGKEFQQAVLSLTPAPSTSTLASSSSPNNPFLSSSRHTTTTSPPSPPRVVSGQSIPIKRFTEEVSTKEGEPPRRGGVNDCYWGELTDLGRESTLRFGSTLRQLYVDRLNFLPRTLDDTILEDGTVQFRSTNMPRTIESLQQIIQGLYEQDQRRGSTSSITIKVRNWMDENLYPNTICKRLRSLDALSIQESAKTHNPSLERLDSLIVPVLGKPLRIDSTPRANGILDTLMVCRAHGIEVPDVFGQREVLETLERGVVHEWFDAYQIPEFRRLAMGRLFSDLSHSFESKTNPTNRLDRDGGMTNRLKLAIYSCHDTSIGGILNALQAFDGRWPPFTSHLGIELLRQSSSPKSTSSLSSSGSSSTASSASPSFLQRFLPSSTSTKPYYVRVLYNGRPLTLPACQSPSNHLEGTNGQVCTYEAFQRLLREWKMEEKEWREVCGRGGAE